MNNENKEAEVLAMSMGMTLKCAEYTIPNTLATITKTLGVFRATGVYDLWHEHHGDEYGTTIM